MSEPGNLMVNTRQMLSDCDMTLPEIYAATGISFYWLRKFKSGTIKNPSVNTVQRLYEFLSGENLLSGK